LTKHSDLHVTLTILIGVALTCVLLYWNGGPSQQQAAENAEAITSPRPSPPPKRLETPSVESKPTDTAFVVSDRAVSPLRATGEIPESDYDAPELPIVFAFSERFVYATEEDTEGNLVNASKRVKEGIVSNSSDKPLIITATELNIPTQETSQGQFVLAAGAQLHFGTDHGLKMISGDQITLHSPSHKDLVRIIP
jgi:hypothetical protein